MSLEPEIPEHKFLNRLTIIAKEIITQECVNNGEVEYKDYVAHEYEKFTDYDIINNYPIAVEEYCEGQFGPDASDILSQNQTDAIREIRERLFINALDNKIKELINGEWDAIKTETEEYTVTEEKKIFDRN